MRCPCSWRPLAISCLLLAIQSSITCSSHQAHHTSAHTGRSTARILVGLQEGQPVATECSQGCTARGVCHEELGECYCPRHMTGPDCATKVDNVTAVCREWGFPTMAACMARTPAICVNACNNRGGCIGGFCHCQPGFYGVSCELSLDDHGKPELLAGLGYTVRPQGPRIYVYELPGQFHVYKNIYRMDRPLYLLFLQRLLGAGVRVADPEQADYFYIPVRLRWQDGRLLKEAIEYIRQRWPYWDRLQGHKHIVIHTGDMGRVELTSGVHELANNMIFLTHWGLTRYHPTGRWQPSHRPGQDIVVPILVQPSLVESYKMTSTPLHPMHARARNEDTLLFFAGRVCGNRKPPMQGVYPACRGEAGTSGYSAQTRQRIYYHHSNRTGYKIVTGSKTYAEDMASAKFCLAPTGSGHGKRNVLVSVLGCIPVTVTDHVMQPFQPELDWSTFSIHVAEDDIPMLHERVAAVSTQQHQAMQASLRCAAQHLFWSTLFGSIMQEDGRFDAFETVMAILSARLRHPHVPPEELAAVDVQLAAFMRCEAAGAAVNSSSRMLCTHTKGDIGAPPCKRPGMPMSPLLIPGGALCSQAVNLAQCPRWA